MKSKNYVAGFSLIEMAVVLVVMGLLIGYLILPLGVQRENRNILEARKKLQEIEEALYGFAIANDRLPCPATSTPASVGAENPAGGGVCQNPRGFVPAVTLGINGAVNCDGLLTDPWGQPYRYSVTTSAANAYTTAGGIQAAGMAALSAINNLQICDADGCPNVLSNNAVAVVYSIGGNWATFGSNDENQNAGEANQNSTCGLPANGMGNDDTYVSRDRSDIVGSEYDDIMIWISPNILFAKMLAAGRLP